MTKKQTSIYDFVQLVADNKYCFEHCTLSKPYGSTASCWSGIKAAIATFLNLSHCITVRLHKGKTTTMATKQSQSPETIQLLQVYACTSARRAGVKKLITSFGRLCLNRRSQEVHWMRVYPTPGRRKKWAKFTGESCKCTHRQSNSPLFKRKSGASGRWEW